MNVNYLHDSDLDFLQHCSEEQLANFTRLLTHNEKGKTRLSSVLMRNELFKSMEGHPEQHRRNWQLIAGELQHFGGDSIANKLRGHGKRYRAILLDVSKRLKLKADKEMSTFEIEQQLLEHFLRNTWKKMDETHKKEFLQTVNAKVNELEELLPLLMKDKQLAKGVSHLLSSQLTRILRTHAAMSVLGHGLLRGAGLGGPVGAALNGVKAVSGTAFRVTIPAVLQIACLRRMISATQP
ncbi:MULTISPECIES: acidic protein MsyB [Escherichia]|mgnify:FL=1|uniref:Oxidoreductase n=2 Tax=Escherichia TaxID=561 RepID=A0AAJ3P2T9_ECOLX|nr:MULTISPECIES: acidic protein MsyB [Escherichia]EFN6914001.1 acidic protein MsyB [Escherichia coli O10]OSL50785.1 putative oxidoreductase [Escherichia coli H605]EFB2841368.1 acidic protein MsyB [Escherichia coli]EFB3350325.1 acidic protein MsyB [Escherichia coli]EFC0649626.1 acidic protein MsyB [Escherichia coli]